VEAVDMTAAPEWRARRVLVTGATGLIGSALTARLVRDGAEVTVLQRDADQRSAFVRAGLAGRVTMVSGAIEDAVTVERAVCDGEIDTVVHLAAQTLVGTARRMPRMTFEANVLGTVNVLEACRLHPDLVRRVVVASSDKAYGALAAGRYEETQPLDGRQPYEASKACADLVARSYAASFDLPVVVTRCGNVYGPGDLNWSRLVPGTLRDLLRGVTPRLRSDGSPVREYLFVDDAVDAYLAIADAADRLGGEAFNVASGQVMTVREMYDAVCAAAGCHVEPVVEAGAGDELAFQALDGAKLHDALGWRATTPVADGLARTVPWYRLHLAEAGPW
jgi:CDP-glucose 4,6-dehydratase